MRKRPADLELRLGRRILAGTRSDLQPFRPCTNEQPKGAGTDMEDASKLEQELAASARHILESHARIAHQREIIGHLSDAGQDVTEAEALLRDYRTALPILRRQRWAIPAKRPTL